MAPYFSVPIRFMPLVNLTKKDCVALSNFRGKSPSFLAPDRVMEGGGGWALVNSRRGLVSYGPCTDKVT